MCMYDEYSINSAKLGDLQSVNLNFKVALHSVVLQYTHYKSTEDCMFYLLEFNLQNS